MGRVNIHAFLCKIGLHDYNVNVEKKGETLHSFKCSVCGDIKHWRELERRQLKNRIEEFNYYIRKAHTENKRKEG